MNSIYPLDLNKPARWWSPRFRNTVSALAERNDYSVRVRQSQHDYFRRLDDRLANVARYFQIMRSLNAVDAVAQQDILVLAPPAMGPVRVQFL